jgi:hypothetical protein
MYHKQGRGHHVVSCSELAQELIVHFQQCDFFGTRESIFAEDELADVTE